MVRHRLRLRLKLRPPWIYRFGPTASSKINKPPRRIEQRWEATRAPRRRHTARTGGQEANRRLHFLLLAKCDKSKGGAGQRPVAISRDQSFPAPFQVEIHRKPCGKRSEERRVGKECRSRW